MSRPPAWPSFRRALLLHSGLSDVAPRYDVVVIGAGAAGMSAALFAAIRGAKTLLVEKTGFVGGTSALSAGSLWIPNTRHVSGAGAADSAADVERYLQQIAGNRADAPLRASLPAPVPQRVGVLRGIRRSGCRRMRAIRIIARSLRARRCAGRALEPLLPARRAIARRRAHTGSSAATGVHAAAA